MKHLIIIALLMHINLQAQELSTPAETHKFWLQAGYGDWAPATGSQWDAIYLHPKGLLIGANVHSSGNHKTITWGESEYISYHHQGVFAGYGRSFRLSMVYATLGLSFSERSENRLISSYDNGIDIKETYKETHDEFITIPWRLGVVFGKYAGFTSQLGCDMSKYSKCGVRLGIALGKF